MGVSNNNFNRTAELLFRVRARDSLRIYLKGQCPACRTISKPAYQPQQPADDPTFMSVVDNPPNLVRTGRRHGLGIIMLGKIVQDELMRRKVDQELALIPLTAFALGSWQVQRLDWKTRLIAKFEDRLVRDPLPLPPQIDPVAIKEFDYRRVYATGRLRHDQEMLIGPRIHDGKDGYLVVTPLEREGRGTAVLVNRGWISRKFKDQNARPDGLPHGQLTVQGLLREPWKKNMFTPNNNLQKGEFYFPDVAQMAELTDSQPVWIEETMEPNLLRSYDRESRGIPIGRPSEVNLRNNHAQYIFTWYALAAATSVMLWMVVKKPPADVSRRVRQSREWQ